MVTPQFIALWFAASALIFLQIKFWASPDKELPRDWNGFTILTSQAIGAGLAYALH